MSRKTDFGFNASGSQKFEVVASDVILSKGTECVIMKKAIFWIFLAFFLFKQCFRSRTLYFSNPVRHDCFKHSPGPKNYQVLVSSPRLVSESFPTQFQRPARTRENTTKWLLCPFLPAFPSTVSKEIANKRIRQKLKLAQSDSRNQSIDRNTMHSLSVRSLTVIRSLSAVMW